MRIPNPQPPRRSRRTSKVKMGMGETIGIGIVHWIGNTSSADAIGIDLGAWSA